MYGTIQIMTAMTKNPAQNDSSLFDEINKLVEAHRTECLWFMRKDYFPTTNPERLTVLRYLATYGDRATFVKARYFRDCLLQNSSAMSAKP